MLKSCRAILAAFAVALSGCGARDALSAGGAVGPDLAVMQRCDAADEEVASRWSSLVVEARSAGFQHTGSARLLRRAIAACRPVALAFAVQHPPAGHRKIAEQCGAGYMAQVRAYEDLLSAVDEANQQRDKATLLLKSCDGEMRAFMRSALTSWL